MSEKRKRDKLIRFFVNEAEKELLDKKVADSHLDRSKYLRKVALGETIINIDMKRLDGVIYELNKIGTNINQIAKFCNSNNQIYKSDIQELQNEMNKVCEIIANSF